VPRQTIRSAGPEVRFADLDVTTARAVGELCALTGASDVVDAHVALHALRLDLSVATSDPVDFEPYTDLAVIAV
jgi:predicted nucleic acid-binding protein